MERIVQHRSVNRVSLMEKEIIHNPKYPWSNRYPTATPQYSLPTLLAYVYPRTNTTLSCRKHKELITSIKIYRQ